MPDSPSTNDSVILLFLKAPVPGQVKTRLAADIGVEAATQIYEILVQSQLQRLPREYAVEIHFSPASAGSRFATWLGDTPNYYPQVDGDLGDRLKHAVKAAFARGAREVICIGADCPSLLPAHLVKTRAQLRSNARTLCSLRMTFSRIVFGYSKLGVTSSDRLVVRLSLQEPTQMGRGHFCPPADICDEILM